MKRILWLAMISLSVASLTAAKEPTPAATEAGMPAGLAERAAAYGAAMAKRDVAALDDIWADDYTFINPHGDLLTKKQRLENIKSGTTATTTTTTTATTLPSCSGTNVNFLCHCTNGAPCSAFTCTMFPTTCEGARSQCVGGLCPTNGGPGDCSTAPCFDCTTGQQCE